MHSIIVKKQNLDCLDGWMDGWMMPSPTSGVRAEVKTELLCTMKVIPAPTKMAM